MGAVDLSQQLATALTLAATGGVGAYLKNRMYRKTGKSGVRVKKPATRVKSGSRKRRPRRKVSVNINSNMPSYTLTKNRKTYKENHSLENRATSLQVRGARVTPMKMINSIIEPHWFRVQGLSQYDTSTGFYPIANRSEPGGVVVLPMHIWDLTCCQNYNGTTTLTPNVGYWCGFASTASNANTVIAPLGGQDVDGNTTPYTNLLLKENTSGNTIATFPVRKGFHHYSHIKMNLYGVRKRATRFKVDLVMVKEEFADFITGADTNIEKKKLFDYLSRPFMYTNLNSGDPQVRNDIKILKSYEVIIAPTTTDEYAGASAVPHIQTLNFFVNHNRIRRYDWKSGDPANHQQNAALDVELATDYQDRTDNKYRVYMLVRALCPERRGLSDVNNNIGPEPISEPSYDCVIRQKFSFPT